MEYTQPLNDCECTNTLAQKHPRSEKVRPRAPGAMFSTPRNLGEALLRDIPAECSSTAPLSSDALGISSGGAAGPGWVPERPPDSAAGSSAGAGSNGASYGGGAGSGAPSGAAESGVPSGGAGSGVPSSDKHRVVVPAGVSPGQKLRVALPDGKFVELVVPAGAGPGTMLEVERTVTVHVAIPPTAKVGDLLQAPVQGGGTFAFTVPPGTRPGATIAVSVPASQLRPPQPEAAGGADDEVDVTSVTRTLPAAWCVVKPGKSCA